MLTKSKTDPELGKKVQQYLKKQGICTPNYTIIKRRSEEKIDLIETYFTEIMKVLEINLKDDSLKDTPTRVAKMFINEIFWGLDPNNFPKCTTIENKMNYDEMVMEKNICVQSHCEHHFVIIDGYAHVGYIPDKKVLGLSKINRIVEYFSRRPQIQERLTEQIYSALNYVLETDNIAVVINAKHYCVKSRGVEDMNSSTVTSKLGGLFKKYDLRNEFMNMIR